MTNETNKQNNKIALLLGGYLSPERRESALTCEKPRIDVMEMEIEFGGKLLDYGWLEQRAKNEPLTWLLLQMARKLGHWSEFLVLRAVWTIRQFNIVYATGEDVGVPAAILMRLFRIRRPQIIMRTEQPVYGSTPFRRFISTSMLRFAIPRIKTILCRTEAHASFLREKFHLTPERAFFHPESTDTQYFSETASSSPTEVLDSLSGSYIVSAGLEMRDYETLISAARNLPVTVIIGAGSPWAKVRYDTQVDLPENVIVRSFSQPEMRELYRSAALVVLAIKPTTRACGMNVILEAWAMQRPVIASRTEGLVSYIEDRQTGYFVTPGDVDELRQTIQFLLNNKAEAQRIGQNGQNKVQTDFSIEHYIEAVKMTMNGYPGAGL
jgi:glycosyltransferase involved in cell wall biosynthesis